MRIDAAARHEPIGRDAKGQPLPLAPFWLRFLDAVWTRLMPGLLPTTATDGFGYLPTMAGAPIGTPAETPADAAPVVIDTINGKLWAYYGGAWHFVVLT